MTASARLRPKVVCIGLNKTGTSTFRRCMERLGYRVAGPQKHLLRAFRAGDTAPLLAFLETHEAFEDVPFNLAWREIYGVLGREALYVLTVRRSADAWFDSLVNHERGARPFTSDHRLLYGFMKPFGRRQAYRRIYDAHNQDVRDFFAARGASDRLVEIAFDRGEGWEKLCTPLGLAPPAGPVPHANRGTDLKRRPLRVLVNRVLEPVYARFAGGDV